MKVIILQFSSRALFLIPATLGKRPVFGVRQSFLFPPEVSGNPLASPAEFVKFVRKCTQEIGGSTNKYILSFENDDLVSREYQHLPASGKHLEAVARLEAEVVLPDGCDKYLVENYEYGQLNEVTGKCTAVLFAMKKELTSALHKACQKNGIHLLRLIPPVAGLLHASKNLDTAGKTIALVSLSAESTRLVIIKDGFPLFQRSFVPIYDDLINLICETRGIGYQEAVAYINDVGFSPDGLGGQENGAVSALVEASTGEIIRNLGMVLSSMRLELDKIVVSGVVPNLPGFSEFCDRLGLDIPVENADLACHRGTQPLLEDRTRGAGLRPSSFFLLNGLLTMPKNTNCDFFRAVHRRTHMRKNNVLLLGAISLLAVGVMLLEPLLFYSGVLRQASDTAALMDARFDETKVLLAQKEELTEELSRMEMDASLTPKGTSQAGQIARKVFTLIADKVQSVESVGLDNKTGSISLNFTTRDFESYISVKNNVIADGYFSVLVPFSATISDNGSCVCSVTLLIADFKAPGPSSAKGGQAK